MSFLQKIKNKKVIITSSIILVIGLGGAIYYYNQQKIKTQLMLEANSYIETYTIADNEKIFVNGVITPSESQDFNPLIEQISKLNVTNGKVVKKGDLLYTVKDQSILDEIDSLKDQVSALKKSNTDNDPLLNAEISKLNAQISSLDKKAYTDVDSPFDGKVYINEQINNIEQASYMTVISNDFYMKGQVSEQDLPKLQIDDPVSVLVFANNNNLEGRISFISDRPSPVNDMNMGGQGNLSYYDINVSFENQDNLVNGFHVQGSIEIIDSFVKIPTSALIEDKKEDKTEYYVFEDLNGILKKRIVEVYDQNDEFTTLKSGLDKNISIVRYPSPEMKEGDSINSQSSSTPEDTTNTTEENTEPEASEEGTE